MNEPTTELMPISIEPAWPKVIGVISIVYAALGMTCVSIAAAGTLVMPFLPTMFTGGVKLPLWMTVWAVAVNLILFCLGILLLRGGIALVRRQPVAIRRLKLWSVLRLVVLVVWLIVTVISLPANIEMQVRARTTLKEDMNERFGDDAPLIPPLSEDQAWTQTIIMTAVMAGLVAIYPLFIGFFMSRKTVAEQVAGWHESYDEGLDDGPLEEGP